MKKISLLVFLVLSTQLVFGNPPEDVTISINGIDTNLSWSDSACTDLFYIYRSTYPHSGFVKIDSTETTFYTDIGGSNETKYFYYVTAKSDFEWCDVPAGDYTWGQNDVIQNISYEYKIMKYEITNYMIHFMTKMR